VHEESDDGVMNTLSISERHRSLIHSLVSNTEAADYKKGSELSELKQE
jgi:hypothetical protein